MDAFGQGGFVVSAALFIELDEKSAVNEKRLLPARCPAGTLAADGGRTTSVCLRAVVVLVLSSRIRAVLPTYFSGCADHIAGSVRAFYRCHVIILPTKLNHAAAGIG